jgi:hypothetical protein
MGTDIGEAGQMVHLDIAVRGVAAASSYPQDFVVIMQNQHKMHFY